MFSALKTPQISPFACKKKSLKFDAIERENDSLVACHHINLKRTCSVLFVCHTDCVKLCFTESESVGGESRVRVMHVQHTQGPVDGSIYATVSKSRSESLTKQTNGSLLHNGPLTHSADSGISSTSGEYPPSFTCDPVISHCCCLSQATLVVWTSLRKVKAAVQCPPWPQRSVRSPAWRTPISWTASWMSYWVMVCWPVTLTCTMGPLCLDMAASLLRAATAGQWSAGMPLRLALQGAWP